MIEISSPDHNLVWIADVIERGDQPTGGLPTILLTQHLRREPCTVRRTLGAQSVDAM